MRVRAMSSTGDMQFGHGSKNFLINTPAAVAQLVGTRLNLWQDQWFLDLSEGTPYATQILGFNTQSVYDNALITRILGTTGVTSLAAYQSNLNHSTRLLTYEATINTQFGQATIQATSVIVPPGPSSQMRDSSGNPMFSSGGDPMFASS